MNDVLVSNGYTLDLTAGVPTPITFSIAEIRDPSKRQRDFSKKIVLPGTANNLAFFRGSFSFHVTDSQVSYDSTAKTPARFFKKGIEIMPNAVIKLETVTLKENNYQFEITLFSETVDIYLLLSQINVNELDWSEYQYTLTRQAIKDSWLTPIGSGYKYPLIQYRQRAGNLIWNTTDLMPYVFLKEVFVKMMQYVDVDFDSNFIESERFKSILYGFAGGEITATLSLSDQLARRVELDAISFDYSESIIMTEFSNVYTFFDTILFNQQLSASLTETTDALGQFNQSFDGSNTFTIARTGNYNIVIQGVLLAEITNQLFPSFPIDIYRFGTIYVNVLKNGAVIQSQQYGDEFNTDSRSYNINFTVPISCIVGDQITITFTGLQVDLGTQIEGGNITALLTMTETTPLQIDLLSIDANVTDGSTVDLWRFLPAQKCSEVFSSILKMFNLYYSNPDVYDVVTIEPSVDYYSQTNDFDDITELVDYSQPITYKSLANTYGKQIAFRFKENKDTDAENYFNEFGKRYNDYDFTQSSFYAKGDMVTQLAFSSIVPVEIATGILIPRLCKIEASGLAKLNKGEPRVMMWNGMKSGTWTLRNTDNPALSEVLTEYPCVHHFDDWEDPEFDLSFQLVDELQYLATFATSTNLFSEYHYEALNEVISPSASLVTLYLKLSAQVVKNMDWSRLKMINGALFKLNLISDFDSEITESTKIELIKVLNARKKKTSKYSFPTASKIITTERFLEGQITQTGTTAPSVVEFSTNNAGLSIIGTRYVSVGVYDLLFDDGTFPLNEGLVLLTSGLENSSIQGYVLNDYTVRIETHGNGTGHANGKLQKTNILIKSYK